MLERDGDATKAADGVEKEQRTVFNSSLVLPSLCIGLEGLLDLLHCLLVWGCLCLGRSFTLHRRRRGFGRCGSSEGRDEMVAETLDQDYRRTESCEMPQTRLRRDAR